MRLPTMLFVSFSLVGCASIPRPDTYLGVVNAPAGHVKGYNLRSDYDADGNLKPGAKAEFRPAKSVYDVNKYICTDPDGFAELKAYIQKIRDAYKDCNKR